MIALQDLALCALIGFGTGAALVTGRAEEQCDAELQKFDRELGLAEDGIELCRMVSATCERDLEAATKWLGRARPNVVTVGVTTTRKPIAQREGEEE